MLVRFYTTISGNLDVVIDPDEEINIDKILVEATDMLKECFIEGVDYAEVHRLGITFDIRVEESADKNN